ncbi:Serpentine Receptor, class U [Caenorhabditis elegans]|uniref:Serpentine Receptor, class U n=1 Tax=Caenorhabditis elegans TaxID=6239 RepID=Q8MXJ2_CAEEL|nr:Serpentine Receptor, class U [Caenorhabditis elegans]CCD63716.1 Serpentine Receptor, class U [Caenorhabditis elegans]|eukprot:NP_872027.1 Uncharacterized protein CELE_C08F1.10 [Caenorhabditis elegans]
MTFLTSFFEKDYLWDSKYTTPSLQFYYFYIWLAIFVISCFDEIQISYLGHKTPQATIHALIEDFGSTSSLCYTACFIVLVCGVPVAMNLIVKFITRKQYTIKSFCVKRYLTAVGFVFLNILLPGKIIAVLYFSWAKEMIQLLIQSTICFLLYKTLRLLLETEFPIHYRLSKTTKITMPQKLFITFFLAVSGASFIGISFINLDQFTDEYVGLAFYYTTRYFCPAINIIAIPMIYVAFLAYNSEEFAFSGKEPTSGRFWYGVCRWNEKLGEWEHVETIPEKPESLVLDV